MSIDEIVRRREKENAEHALRESARQHEAIAQEAAEVQASFRSKEAQVEKIIRAVREGLPRGSTVRVFRFDTANDAQQGLYYDGPPGRFFTRKGMAIVAAIWARQSGILGQEHYLVFSFDRAGGSLQWLRGDRPENDAATRLPYSYFHTERVREIDDSLSADEVAEGCASVILLLRTLRSNRLMPLRGLFSYLFLAGATLFMLAAALCGAGALLL